MTPSLLEWQNLLFLIPLGVGVLLVLLSATAGLHGPHGAHGGAAHGAGAHAGAGAHGGATHGTTGHAAEPAGAGAGHGPHAHLPKLPSMHGHGSVRSSGSHGQPHPNGAARGTRSGAKSGSASERSDPIRMLISLLGLSRAPAVVLLWAFLIGWGFCGFWALQLFHPPVGLAAVAAAVGGAVVARVTAAVTARVMPQDESAVLSRGQLLGEVGTAIFPVTENTGRLHVYDGFGTLHEEPCRLEPGQQEIEKGGRVLLIDYDDQRGVFLVERVS